MRGLNCIWVFLFESVWNLFDLVAYRYISDLLVGSENTHDSSQDEMKFNDLNDSSDNNDDDDDDDDDSSGSGSNSESDEGMPFI